MKSRKPPSYFQARIQKSAPVDLHHTDVGARFRAEQARLEKEASNKVVPIGKRKAA